VSNRVSDLEPATRAMCQRFLADCEERMLPPLRITHTLRTMDEQMHLYAKGRKRTPEGWVVTDRSLIVTRAQPGQSAHNFGAAFDICFRGHDPYPADDELWESVGAVGENLGLVWGGRWKGLVDKPHFELRTWRGLPMPAGGENGG
jgi:peptidoglycan L-alanyl-D-glutamate endopeptidase CwlK